MGPRACATATPSTPRPLAAHPCPANPTSCSPLPFCAFNGGNDVFVDVGNKSLGLEALMNYLGLTPPEVLHVGDRFTDSGNDSATRDCCSILWVANPEETDFFIKLLLADIRTYRREGGYYYYIE